MDAYRSSIPVLFVLKYGEQRAEMRTKTKMRRLESEIKEAQINQAMISGRLEYRSDSSVRQAEPVYAVLRTGP